MLIFISSQFFSIDFTEWKSVGLPPHCLYRDSLILTNLTETRERILVFILIEINLYILATKPATVEEQLYELEDNHFEDNHDTSQKLLTIAGFFEKSLVVCKTNYIKI